MTSPLILTLTDDGLTAIINAEGGGTSAVTIAEIGLSDDMFIAAPSLTELPGEFGRLPAVSGEAVDDTTIHMVARDGGAGTYTVRGIGIYLADGTLFATYAQTEPIFEKAAVATFLLATDLKLLPGQADLIQFGNANFLNPPATEERAGVARIATAAEVAAGVDTETFITPARLKARTDLFIPLAQRAVANGVATLGADGKVASSQLPAFDAIDVFVVASQAAMLGLAATVADFAIRTDQSKTYILTALPASTLSNWVEFLSPGSPVQAVNGKVGAVVLNAGDVGAAPTTRQVATAGLATGGGDLASDRTINVERASQAEAQAGLSNDRALTPLSIAGILGNIAGRVPNGRAIHTTGLAYGGGDLGSDRTIEVRKASGGETVAGAADDRAVTPLGLASFPKAFGNNGYCTLPGGLIIQWGRFTALPNTVTVVNLPTTFPNAFFSVVAAGSNDTGTNAQDNWAAPMTPPPNNGQFRVTMSKNVADAAYFIAIGM